MLGWIIFLTILLFPAPFIWMKIGPAGYAYYGPGVPDIYVLGFTVLGKDMNCMEIGAGDDIQRWGIMLYLFNAVGSLILAMRGKSILGWQLANFSLLICFPFWLSFFVNAIICNSDGAASDLKVYPHIALGIYIAVVILNYMLLTIARASSTQA